MKSSKDFQSGIFKTISFQDIPFIPLLFKRDKKKEIERAK